MTIPERPTHGEHAGHWDGIYDANGEAGVSWYQAKPTVSMEMLARLGIARDASIVDLGGGASVLVDHLIQAGYEDISVVDLSTVALAQAQKRLGPKASRVRWLRCDVLDWSPGREFDLWHDRAVFHFLVEAQERDDYIRTLRSATHRGSRVVIATFDADGPTHCSGLPVRRYGAQELSELFAPHFQLVASRREDHVTPAGLVQPFRWVALAPTDSTTTTSAIW